MEFNSEYFLNSSSSSPFDIRNLATTTTTQTTTVKPTVSPTVPPSPPPAPIVPAINMTALMISAQNDTISENIVIVLSFISLTIIIAYVLYEVFQPLLKFELYN